MLNGSDDAHLAAYWSDPNIFINSAAKYPHLRSKEVWALRFKSGKGKKEGNYPPK